MYLTIRQIARQAADAEYRAWQRMEARTTEDTLLVDRVADAVSVAVLQHAKWSIGTDYDPEFEINKMLAEFQPSAEPPQTPEPLKLDVCKGSFQAAPLPAVERPCFQCPTCGPTAVRHLC